MANRCTVCWGPLTEIAPGYHDCLACEARSEAAAEGAWLRAAEAGSFYDDPRSF